MDHHVIPKAEDLPPQEYQLTGAWRHVDLSAVRRCAPEMWLERRIPDWLTTYRVGVIMIIIPGRLAPDTLDNLIESFCVARRHRLW